MCCFQSPCASQSKLEIMAIRDCKLEQVQDSSEQQDCTASEHGCGMGCSTGCASCVPADLKRGRKWEEKTSWYPQP